MKLKPIDLFTATNSRSTKKKPKEREKSVHVSISEYVRIQYKDVIFFSDSSGVRLTMGQAVTLKRMRAIGCKIPDMIILEPRGGFHGLLLEIKADMYSPYKKDGTLQKDPHIQEQEQTMERLRAKRYACFFAVGIDHAKQIIDNYMAL